MSLAETANIENIAARDDKKNRFGGRTALQQFARAGLDLKIGEFRQMCEEIVGLGVDANPHEFADILFSWMTATLEPDA